jgi:hypothetical protein
VDQTFVVSFLVRKGLGPVWNNKDVTVFFDDIDPETTESKLIDMAIYDAKEQLRKQGYTSDTFIYQDINSA